ncbi:MAG: TlyA family RNA methyltransferase [Anaerolineales bacterium]|nr:TlyA family RNA methyltransferase [Anaerolineales bacterium]
MAEKTRVDQLLVKKGLVDDLNTARRLVMAGKVRASGQLVQQPSSPVSSNAELSIEQGPQYVSRAGVKLAALLDKFSIKIDGRVCADVGASTGGFTDCLLQRGAERVYAVDVGYGILDWSLRQDERVVVMERTNVRYLDSLPQPVSFVSVDVSFISLELIFPVVKNWFSPAGGELGVLIKPQFEASRAEAARGEGVIQDPEIHRRVLWEILTGARKEGYQTRGLMTSPLPGQEGNREFLAWLRWNQEEVSSPEPDQLIADLF